MKYENLKKITILIGPNGSGKTTFVDGVREKIENDKTKKIDVLSIENEDLKSLHDFKSSFLQKAIKNFEKELKDQKEFKAKISSTTFLKLKKQLSEECKSIPISEKFKKFDDDKKILSQSNIRLSMTFQLKIQEELFNLKPIFNFNNYQFEYEKAPSGVKKILWIYFAILEKNKISSKKEILIIIEELENHLHPNWIKVAINVLEELFKISDNKNKFIITTHNPEVVGHLRNYIKNFATPLEYGKSIRYIALDEAHKKYEEINEMINDHKKIDFESFEKKVKVRLNLELARFLFCQKEKVLLCEGSTDQIVFRTLVDCVVIPTFGSYNFGLYLGMYYGLYPSKEKFSDVINIIADMDPNNKNEKMKEKLDKLLEEDNVFYFSNCMEKSLFNKEKKQNGWEKWKSLEEYYPQHNNELKDKKQFFENKGIKKEVDAFFTFIKKFKN